MPEPDRTPEHLPPGLRETVGVVEAILGQVVARAEGTALFDAVEGIRRHMVAFREAASDADREAALDRAAGMLAGLSLEEKTALARAYTLYLQLVNVCEHAYRTHRLHRRPGRDEAAAARARLTFVLTAHPTESRSPGNIRVLRRVQDHVIESLAKDRPVDRAEIENLIHLAWRIGTHPPRKPSVEDEANHLFSLLTDPILSEVIALTEAGHSVLFRSWVGGDKDGHPDVGPPQTEAAMSLARGRLLAFVEARSLEPVRRDVALAGGRTVESALVGLEDAVSGLATVSDGDGGRVAALRPWVLCWTQTRLLLHAWLGAGDAWRALRDEPDVQARLEEARREDPLFRSYARLLSFTMAKTAPALWRRYRRALAAGVPDELIEELTGDYEAAMDLALRALGAGTLLPDRPWLEESIRYRAPMIHPLNLLQIELLAKQEWSEAEVRLFRETVTGIAAGMLTTG